MKEFKCKDAGHACDWKVRSEREDEIVRQASEHGRNAHGVKDATADQIKPLIHDVA
jgi:predicted small metal-binding protein